VNVDGSFSLLFFCKDREYIKRCLDAFAHAHPIFSLCFSEFQYDNSTLSLNEFF
jgi:hypothetical protein